MATTAFALAGLGGFNAHGAGFLTAASECGVVPDLVTATSGQIVVLADWLRGKDLEKAHTWTSLQACGPHRNCAREAGGILQLLYRAKEGFQAGLQ